MSAITISHGQVEWLSSICVGISARPSLSLPEHAAVLDGEKTTLSCTITGFYPQLLVVRWLQQAGLQNVSLADVCTSSPIPHSDHTYNLTSHMSVQGNRAVNQGAVYTCQIEHRSFSWPQSQTVRLSVLRESWHMIVLFHDVHWLYNQPIKMYGMMWSRFQSNYQNEIAASKYQNTVYTIRWCNYYFQGCLLVVQGLLFTCNFLNVADLVPELFVNASNMFSLVCLSRRHPCLV